MGITGSLEEYKSPATVAVSGSSTVGGSSRDAQCLAYTGAYGIFRMNNNLSLNLTGWNYITFEVRGFSSGFDKTIYVGFSKNSQLTSLSFDSVWKKGPYNGESIETVKFDIRALNGLFFFYCAVQTNSDYPSQRYASCYLREAQLSTV